MKRSRVDLSVQPLLFGAAAQTVRNEVSEAPQPAVSTRVAVSATDSSIETSVLVPALMTLARGVSPGIKPPKQERFHEAVEIATSFARSAKKGVIFEVRFAWSKRWHSFAMAGKTASGYCLLRYASAVKENEPAIEKVFKGIEGWEDIRAELLETWEHSTTS